MVQREMVGYRGSLFGHPVGEQVDVNLKIIGQVGFQSHKVSHDDVPRHSTNYGSKQAGHQTLLIKE